MAVSENNISVPKHIAIIMDGNGRWAQARGLPRLVGHQQGVEAVKRTIRAARDLGVQYLTLYTFSSENWKRPEEEVTGLMGLLRRYLKEEIAEFHKENGRLKIIGERAKLPKDIAKLADEAEKLTAGNTGITITMAISYGGRQEITEAVKNIAKRVVDGSLSIEAIDEKIIADSLYTAGIPDPDLLIRTSGEQRISNFLLWQIAYAEFMFTDVMWPDFGKEHLEKAIESFGKRERRFGNIKTAKK